jgi:iron only hydrogenase large subunit-like protein
MLSAVVTESFEHTNYYALLFSGWICYAEKTHGSYILPYISTVKSPQQIMGSLVKSYLPRWIAGCGSNVAVTPDQVYHVTVMPCYDKKLEASRQDFYNDVYSTRDVDCVLTSGD